MTELEEEAEKENNNKEESISIISPNQICLLHENKKNLKEDYVFDKIFNNKNEIEEIYNISSKQLIYYTLNGFNTAIICYGQTGMGKTYTINEIVTEIGRQIFDEIDLVQDINNLFKVEIGGFEIYKEQISDLLDLININLELGENKYKRLFVDNLTFFTVNDQDEYNDIINKVLSKRNNNSLSMKEFTSRSNNIIVINVYRYTAEKKQLKTGCLYLVDLEGSEKITKNKIEGESHEEKKILNKSLSSLRHLVQTLSSIRNEPLIQSNYIPYRESKLTELLCDCFGGNCYTSLILNCCLSDIYLNETRNTLLFGQKVKKIQNKPMANIENNADQNPIVIEMIKLFMENMKNREKREQNKLIKKYEKEIAMLKKQILHLKELIKMHLKEIEELKNKIKNLEEEKKYFNNMQKEYEKIKRDNYDLKGKINILEEKINKYEINMRKLSLENEKLKKDEEEIYELKNIINNLNNKIEQYEINEKENNKMLRDKDKKIKELEKEINKKNDKIKNMEETIILKKEVK